MQQLLTAWAWLLLLTMQGSRATILSKSTIEKCDRTTSKDMKCFQKIVVQLAVAAGKDSEEDEISATIDTVSNGSFTRSLQDPQIIKLSKSSVGYAYPLEYLQNFNRQPYEEYRRVDKCKAEDCWDANLPEAKKKIYWGVCCLCGGNSHHRGVDAKCGAAKHDIAHLSRKGTRHCLKWHPQWFPTFIIGLATMEFNIYIDISVGYGNSVTRLNLNPNNLMDVNDDKTVIAKLEGDLVSYKMPPSFPSVFLSHPPNPNGINASEWLIIDRHKYSESGAVCDLIGTSYEAFTLVNLPCTRQFGYCLAYQLEDYIRVDCPAGIQASPAVIMSLRPNEPKTLHFELNAESFNSQTFNCSVRLRDSEGEVADALEAFVSVTATQFTNVTKLQSEGAFLKLDRLHNGGGFLGVLGNALGGVFGFTKTIASNFSGAFARLGIGLIKSIFGPNVGALVEGFFQAASALMDWILGGFGIGNIFGTGQCNCASEYDVLCILANFCFAKIIGLLGFLLVLVAVALSCVLLYRMGVLGPVGTCLGHSLLLPMSMCKSEDDEDGESDKEQDMPTSSNMKEPHIVSVQSQNVVPWTSMPPQAPYQYGYGFTKKGSLPDPSLVIGVGAGALYMLISCREEKERLNKTVQQTEHLLLELNEQCQRHHEDLISSSCSGSYSMHSTNVRTALCQGVQASMSQTGQLSFATRICNKDPILEEQVSATQGVAKDQMAALAAELEAELELMELNINAGDILFDQSSIHDGGDEVGV